MTEQEFLALEPRDRDALVATEVMGLDLETIAADRFHAAVRKYRGKGYLGNEKWPDGCRKEKREYFRKPDPFTTNITSAWQVVEKMREDGYHVQYNSPGFFSNGHRFSTYKNHYCLMQKGATPAAALFEGWGECLEADTAPLAICLAALKANGVIT